jgi:hypothetical protein
MSRLLRELPFVHFRMLDLIPVRVNFRKTVDPRFAEQKRAENPRFFLLPSVTSLPFSCPKPVRGNIRAGPASWSKPQQLAAASR